MVFLELFIFIALTLANGVFVMSEMALVSIRRSRLTALAEDGDRKARAVLDLSDHPTRFLSAMQIGITVTSLLAGASSGAQLSDRLAAYLEATLPVFGAFTDEVAFAVVILLMTFFTLIFGELVPKRLALARPEPIALAMAGFVRLLVTISSPVVHLLSFCSNAILGLVGLSGRADTDVTEEEVKHVLAEGEASGVLDADEREILEGVMRVADRPVRTIMTPRTDLFWIDLNDSLELNRREIASCPYSLVVAARGSIDETVGVVFKKDLLTPALEGRDLDIEAALRQPVVVPEGAQILKLLEIFRNNLVHCAFVVDEYGSLQGLVTLTDIIEGIAGELADVDTIGGGPVQRDDGSWLFDGDINIDDLGRQIDLPEMDLGSYHTLGGMILSALNRIPTEGDKAVIGDWIFEVVDMDGRRIDKVLVTARTAADLPREDVA